MLFSLKFRGFQLPAATDGSTDRRELRQSRKNKNAPVTRNALAATGKFGGLPPTMTAATRPQAIASTAVSTTATTAS